MGLPFGTVMGDSADAYLVDLFDSTAFTLLGIAVAFGVGAIHALAPGHGKTLAAACLVGPFSRLRDGVALGIAVAAMHTLSVLALAVAWPRRAR